MNAIKACPQRKRWDILAINGDTADTALLRRRLIPLGLDTRRLIALDLELSEEGDFLLEAKERSDDTVSSDEWNEFSEETESIIDQTVDWLEYIKWFPIQHRIFSISAAEAKKIILAATFDGHAADWIGADGDISPPTRRGID